MVSTNSCVCHETSVCESKNKAGQEGEPDKRRSYVGLRIRLLDGGSRREVDEHEGVGDHAEDEAKDNDGMPAPLDGKVTNEAKEDAARHPGSCHDDAGDSSQGFGRCSGRSKTGEKRWNLSKEILLLRRCEA